MSEEIVALFTASQLNHHRLLEWRVQSVLDRELGKGLEVFVQNMEKSRKAIPAAEYNLRKAIILFLLNDNAGAQSLLSQEKSTVGQLYNILNLIVLEDRQRARTQMGQIAAALLKESDQGLLIVATRGALDLADAGMGRKLLDKVDGKSAGDFADYLKAYLLEVEKKHQAALDAFEKLSQRDGALRGYALFHYARLLDMWGFDEEALEAYHKIESLGFTFEEALVNTGVLHEDKGEHSVALRYYNRALKINPNNLRALLYHSDAESCLDMLYDERKMKQDIKTSEILAIPISDFELSVRSRNCLSKMGIFTLKDLITKTEQELMGYKNFGETSLKEIRAMLSKKGLHLGMTRVEEQPLAERIRLNTQLLNQNHSFRLDQMDTPVEELNLSYRTKSALHKMGFESLRDITMRTGRDLEANPNFSPACMQEVNALLEERGLSYRPETSTSRPDYDSSGSSLLGDASAGEVLVADEGGGDDDRYDD